MGKVADTVKLLGDLGAHGQTRFLMTGLVIVAICFLAHETEAGARIYNLVAGSGAFYVACKTLTDLFCRGRKARPDE